MQEWPDVERRKHNIELMGDILRRLDAIDLKSQFTNEKIDKLSERIEHTNNNTKAFKVLLEEDINDIRVSIQGDEARNVPGLSSKIKTLIDELSVHILQDRLSQGVMITILLAVLGWTVFSE